MGGNQVFYSSDKRGLIFVSYISSIVKHHLLSLLFLCKRAAVLSSVHLQKEMFVPYVTIKIVLTL